MSVPLKQRVRQDWHKIAFAGSFFVAACATITVCGGLAALTNYCLVNQPLGLGAGFDLNPPMTVFSTEVMRIQRAIVSTDTGAFDCGRFFRFDWTLWALQVVFLLIVGISWYRGTIHRYQAGHWALGAAVTAWHMYKINYIMDMDYWTTGQLHTNGIITAGGLLFCCIGNYCMFFAGGPYAEYERSRLNNMSGVDMAQPSAAALKAGSFSGTSEEV
ncbi:expressed protein [Chlorella variabilis]|uniref:Expressed protein n=1 Tax=Chlorella variabilis TaxID=554065 RepID=E1ZK38_CHLVA|nr:expressed protein [Chlorella variabilis]EFN53736.1 expressed protein [Chlorella variabilis]|eukprot:XP_005845838.1 expressed protein [Chlorella variabilis]